MPSTWLNQVHGQVLEYACDGPQQWACHAPNFSVSWAAALPLSAVPRIQVSQTLAYGNTTQQEKPHSQDLHWLSMRSFRGVWRAGAGRPAGLIEGHECSHVVQLASLLQGAQHQCNVRGAATCRAAAAAADPDWEHHPP